MNVLFISPLFQPATGGAATYTRHLVDGLRGNSIINQFHVLTEHLPGQSSFFTEGNTYIHRLLPPRISKKEAGKFDRTKGFFQTQIWFSRHLNEFVRKHDIQLIHFHSRYQGSLFYRALRRSELPILADLRDKMLDPDRLVDTASHIICNSESVQQIALASRFPSNKITLIPVAFCPPDSPSQEGLIDIYNQYAIKGKYILYLGDMTFNKGVYDLIDAHQIWQKEVPLLMAGTNRDGSKFEKYIEQAENVRFLGRVPVSDANGLIYGSEILILPSRSEALGQVILEAVSLQTKVICPPNIPEYDRYLPNFALTAVTPQAITQKLTEVWNNPELPKYPLERHNLEGVIDSLTQVYLHMLSRS